MSPVNRLFGSITNFNGLGLYCQEKSDTQQNLLSVCDQPYHTNIGILQKVKEIKILRNYALLTRYKSNRLEIMTHVTSAKLIDVRFKCNIEMIAESVDNCV